MMFQLPRPEQRRGEGGDLGSQNSVTALTFPVLFHVDLYLIYQVLRCNMLFCLLSSRLVSLAASA